MPTVKLTKRIVDATRPADRPLFLWDSELKGFGLKVNPEGRRVFVAQYRNASGRTRRVTLGSYGAFTVDEARVEARKVLGDAARGDDPAEVKRTRRTVPNVNAFLDRYLSDHAEAKNSPRWHAFAQAALARHVRPVLGSRLVTDVSTSDVARLHAAMRDTPRAANRVQAILSKAFGLAETWGLRPVG